MPLFTTTKMTGEIVLHGRGQFLAVHHETAVAVPGDDGAVRMDGLGRDRRRHAVAHGAAGGRQLGAKAAIGVVAMDPGGVVAGAVGDDRIGAAAFLRSQRDDLAHLHLAGQARGLSLLAR